MARIGIGRSIRRNATLKRLFSLLLLGAALTISQAAASEVSPAGIDLVKGASFTEVTDVGGIKGSCFYLYVPSELYNPCPMLTPVIYVYGNKPYDGARDAWTALTSAGLDKIAEAEHGAIVMVNPVGADWGPNDIKVFEAIESYIYFTDGTVKLTYHNLQYAIGEGYGATFINDYLSQNCKRVAGVMTFGGNIGSPYPLYPLPAYIVAGSQKAVDFYMNVNDESLLLPTSGRVDQVKAAVKADWGKQNSSDKTTYFVKSNPVRKVIVSKKIATRLDADLIADCWKSMFKYTTRTCLTANCWQFSSSVWNNAEYTLVARPNYEAAGMDEIKQSGIGNGIWPSSETNYWYEFVPAAAKKAMTSRSSEKFPLILCLHGGGDHPIYEAESVGWAQLCIDNNLIMVSPNGSGAEELNKLVDYMIGKYPIDTSRIYTAGFSGGARSVMMATIAHPERFAAAAPMSCVVGPNYGDLVAKLGTYSYDLDLPICVGGNGRETESTNHDEQYIWFDYIKGICSINEIAPYAGKLDYSKSPYWGFPVEDQLRFRVPTGFAIWRADLKDGNGVPMVGLVHTEITTHTHYVEYAPIVWEWMKQFSRDTATHKVIYKAN